MGLDLKIKIYIERRAYQTISSRVLVKHTTISVYSNKCERETREQIYSIKFSIYGCKLKSSRAYCDIIEI